MARKLEPAWEGPFIVAGVGPHDSYRLQALNGTWGKHPLNGNHLAPWKADRGADRAVTNNQVLCPSAAGDPVPPPRLDSLTWDMLASHDEFPGSVVEAGYCHSMDPDVSNLGTGSVGSRGSSGARGVS
jgi:hypothetical protein